MNTDVDLENKLVQLAVEELVRAGLRTPLREPILSAVERTPDGPVEVVVPEGAAEAEIEGTDATGSDPTDAASESDAESEPESASNGGGRAGKAARGLVVSAVTFTVLYLALRRLGD